MKRMLMGCLLLLAADAHADEPRAPIYPHEMAAALTNQLPAGWHCLHDLHGIVVFRDEPVYLFNPINMPDPGFGLLQLEFQPVPAPVRRVVAQDLSGICSPRVRTGTCHIDEVDDAVRRHE